MKGDENSDITAMRLLAVRPLLVFFPFLTAMQEEHLRKKSLLKHRTDELLLKALSLKRKSRTSELSITYRIPALSSSRDVTTTITDSLLTAEQIDTLSSFFQGFAQRLVAAFIEPICSDHTAEVTVAAPSRVVSVLSLTWSGGNASSSGAALRQYQTKGNMFAQLGHVLQFVKTNVASGGEGGERHVALLGSFLWPMVAEAVKRIVLVANVPEDSVQLAQYGSIADVVHSFEASAVSLGAEWD